MSASAYMRRRCYDKARYFTERDAQDEAARLAEVHQREFGTYSCGHPNRRHWHVFDQTKAEAQADEAIARRVAEGIERLKERFN